MAFFDPFSRGDEGSGLGPPPPAFRTRRRTEGLGAYGPWLTVAVLFLVLFVVGGIVKGIYADWLWFASLGYATVYRTMLLTRVALFLAGGVVFLLVFGVNVLLARRLAPSPRYNILVAEFEVGASPRIVTITLVAATFLFTLIFASAMASRWDIFLRFFNGTAFGQADPVFNRDLGFYLFTLPLWRFLQSWLLAMLVLTAIAVALTYLVAFGMRGFTVRITGGIKAHLSILAAAILSVFAWGYWLQTFALNYSTHGAVFGATYTDLHARLPALYILLGLAILAAVVTLANLFLRGILLPGAAIALWITAAFILGTLYPNTVQRLQVQPNELAREQPYIERNIRFTRFAYGLDRIEERSYPATGAVSAADVQRNPETIQNIRLWDHRPLLETFNQTQSLRPLYRFVDVDIDRYIINGVPRQVMVSPRELILENLQRRARTWVNERLQFTHGYGVVMTPVNEVIEEGLPNYFLRDIPVRGTPPVQRPELYYGERTDHYVIVKTREQEFDFPQGETNATTVFQGNTGVRLHSWLRRFVYAWEFKDANMLLSQQLTAESLLLYRRDIRERIKTIAPFLRLDDDPYIVIDSGRLFWIQDAYTTSDRFPYAQPSGRGFNYIRNSVKVVVDAYEGTTTFYQADPNDPLIRTYARIFPGLFRPLEEMPAGLRAHLRYPEGLFHVQVEMYRLYHIRAPRVFYNREDVWAVPTEIVEDKAQAVEPYYVIMKLPGEERAEFVLILPLTPAGKQNTIAWIAARMDDPHYGNLIAFRFPTESLVFGPAQVETRIDQTPAISQQFTLWNQSGSRVVRGNLLMIPIATSILFVEPIYLRAEANQLPELKRVVVVNGTAIAMEATLDQALAAVTGAIPAPASPQPPTTGPPPAATVSDLARQAREAYERAQERLRQGDFAGYGREITLLGELLDQLQQATQR